MIWLIFGIILAIIIFAAIGCLNLDNDKKFISANSLFSLLGLLLILFGCFSTIKTGEIGIKTKFGKIISTTTSEGIVWKSPLEKIQKINIKVQKYENETSYETSTKDMQVVSDIKVTINYRVDGENAINLYKQVGINYREVILEPSIEETIKAVISQYTAEEVVTKRSEVALNMNETLNTKLNDYGITSVSVAINNFDFSDAYNQAIENKAVAEQEVETSKNQLEKAKVEAETKKVKAQGESDANAILEKSLTKEILIDKYIEKWNGELPQVSGDTNTFFDINELLK